MAKKQQDETVENVTVEEVKPQVIADESKKGMLFSRNNFASKYVYNEEECMITPKGKIKVDNVDLLKQPLSAGLLLRKIN